MSDINASSVTCQASTVQPKGERAALYLDPNVLEGCIEIEILVNFSSIGAHLH